RSLVMSLPQNDETLQLGIAASQGILGLGWRLLTPTVEATEVFEEGRAMAEKAGDLVSLAALHGTYACVLGLVDGMSDEYVRHSLEATRLADQTDNRGLQIAERAFLGFACVFAGRLERGLESYLEITGRFKADPALGMEFTGYSPLIGLMTSHAWFLARLGRIEEATEVREEAQRVAREHGDSEVLTWLQLSGIEIASMRADPAAAHECARIAREAGEESGTPQALFVGLITLGTAHRLQDDWDESVEVLEEAVKAVTGGSNRMVEGWVRSELSKSLLARGDFGRAKQEAQTAVTVARTQNSRCDEVRAIVALVNTQLQRADATGLAQVDQELARAQALLDETGARFYQPLVHECRARLAQLRGDQPAASRELEQARRLYDAMAAPLQLARLANDPAQ
ncbi:MAG: tetratricopeptide (TPR) repeat protein, partial [Myxococcota bacterium]